MRAWRKVRAVIGWLVSGPLRRKWAALALLTLAAACEQKPPYCRPDFEKISEAAIVRAAQKLNARNARHVCKQRFTVELIKRLNPNCCYFTEIPGGHFTTEICFRCPEDPDLLGKMIVELPSLTSSRATWSVNTFSPMSAEYACPPRNKDNSMN